MSNTIFISYRVDSDQGLAEAIRKLLLASVDPAPRVFISNAGGLVPSGATLRHQLTDAMRESSAMLAVITSESATREWVFYEAGAAWGRDIIYAPILFGQRPSELPGTIGVYVATSHDDKGAMQRLVRAVAEESGAQVKASFGSSYTAFLRAVNQFSGEGIGEGVDREAPRLGPLLEQIDIYSSGRKTEATGSFREILKDAGSADEVAFLLRLWVEKTAVGYERVQVLRELGDGVVADTWLKCLEGEFDPLPTNAIQLFEQAMEGSSYGDRVHHTASLSLMKTLYRTGDTRAAGQMLVSALQGEDRSYRSRHAVAYCNLRKPNPGTRRWKGRVLVALHSLAMPNADSMEECVRSAYDSGFNALAVHLADLALEHWQTGALENQAGIVTEGCDLTSEAYRHYRAAADLGIGVARVNAGELLAASGVPSAALEMISQMVGEFDGARRSYIHTALAALEDKVQDEEGLREDLSVIGSGYCALVFRIAERSVLRAGVTTSPIGGDWVHKEREGGGLFALKRVAPLPAAVEIMRGGESVGLGAITGDEVLGVSFPVNDDQCATALNLVRK